MGKLFRLLRYDWPLHFIFLLSNWLPDNVLFFRLRGALMKPFFGKTGSDLRIGRNVVFHNPKDIVLGSHIYIAYGSVFLANSLICIGDEVIFGPYCVVASGDHTMLNGSFRYGVINSKPIKIESGCWIGSHSVITAGVSIEKGALVGAGSVITEDVPATTLVGGVPARKIKELNVESE